MNKFEVLEQTQRLRDVAQAVKVCGDMETYHHDVQTISIICDMGIVSAVWIKVLDERIKLLKKELKMG